MHDPHSGVCHFAGDGMDFSPAAAVDGLKALCFPGISGRPPEKDYIGRSIKVKFWSMTRAPPQSLLSLLSPFALKKRPPTEVLSALSGDIPILPNAGL